MNNLLANLNSSQLEAVTAINGPLLIVAGAGTGKTTVITRRIAYLIQNKIAKPNEILALTFTEKAAAEMEDRTLQLLPIQNYDFWISTFHGFCERILQTYGSHIGLPEDYRLKNESQQWMLIHKHLQHFKLDYYKPLASPNKFISALIKHFSKCKDELITPEAYLAYVDDLRLNGGSPELLPSDEKFLEIKRINEVASAYFTYQQLLLQNQALDFGDLINYTYKLFITRPNILKVFQKQFRYILIDEFQDTNFAQYELAKLLAGRDHPRNLAVVGDDDQSIYKFRGASVSNILNFQKDFPEAKRITLNNNYRSSQEILDLAYNFIQKNNPNRLEISLGLSKKLISKNPHPAEIKLLQADDLSGELNLVVTTIQSLKTKNSELSWNDFAILIRSNSSSREIINTLETAGIPYAYFANTGLYFKPLINLLICYLKLLDNYHESGSLYRVLGLPIFHFDPVILSDLTQYSAKKTFSLFETLNDPIFIGGLPENSQHDIHVLVKLLKTHTGLAKTLSTSELIAYIIQDLKFPEMLEPDTLENAQNRELLDQFYKIVQTFEHENEDKTLKNYLQNLDLELSSGNEGIIKFDPNSGPESLKVLTIHSAKGLEFENVFVVNMVDQRFPTRHKKDAIEIPEALIKETLNEGDFHTQEERRLFYVAVTRAKRRIYFSFATDYGGARLKKPSVFLHEAGLLPHSSAIKATGKVVFTSPVIYTKSEVYQKIPTSFSYTDISSFRKCPLEYKYKQYLKLPLPGSAPLSFGITVHKTLEQYLDKYLRALQNNQPDLFGQLITPDLPALATLEKLYDTHWVDEWYASKQQKLGYYEKGQKLIQNFYSYTQSHLPRPKYLEKSFKLHLGEYDFMGKIDRADQGNKGLQIIDYKTGQIPKTKSNQGIDQLIIYQWAAQEYLFEPVESLSYWYLEDNSFQTKELADSKTLLDFQEKILDEIRVIVKTIRHDGFLERHETLTPDHSCNFQNYT